MQVISPNRSPGPSSAMGLSYGKSTAASIGDKGPVGFFAALVISRGDRMLFRRLKNPLLRPCGLDVCDRAREVDLGFSFEDVEGGRSEIAFAADDLAGAVVAFDDRFLIQFEKCARDVLKDREMQKFGGIEDFAFAQFGADDALVRQRASRARDHAFAAGDARRLAHGQVGIEGDAGLVSLTAAGEYPVVTDVVAAANAAVAQDARLVVDRDYG